MLSLEKNTDRHVSISPDTARVSARFVPLIKCHQMLASIIAAVIQVFVKQQELGAGDLLEESEK